MYISFIAGRSRLEPIAIVILSVIMSLASFQLIVESVQIIVGYTSEEGNLPTVQLPVILIAVGTIGGWYRSQTYTLNCHHVTYCYIIHWDFPFLNIFQKILFNRFKWSKSGQGFLLCAWYDLYESHHILSWNHYLLNF